MVTVGTALLVLAVAAVDAALVRDHGFSDPVLDPAATFEFSPRYGAVTQLGVMAWTAAAALCLLAATDQRQPDDLRRWLRRAGLATLLLAADDAFMFHEQLTPLVPGGEKLIMPVLGLVLLAVLLPGSRAVWRHPQRPLVLLTALLLFTSVAIDVVENRASALTGISSWGFSYLEEFVKALGIAAWLGAAWSLARGANSATARALSRPWWTTSLRSGVRSPHEPLRSPTRR